MSGGQMPNLNESVAASLVAGILSAVESLGVDIESMVQRLQLPNDLSRSGNSRVSAQVLVECLQTIEQAADEESTGLLIGQRLAVSHFNALGYAAASCETCNDALQLIPKYEPLIMTQGKTCISHQQDKVLVSWTMTGDYQMILEDIFLSCWVTLGRMLSGQDSLDMIASFTYKMPQQLAPWQKIFGTNLLFEQEIASIQFSENLLSLPLLQSDPFMFEVMTRQANEMTSALQSSSLQAQIEQWLVKQLPFGEPDQLALASHLNMSERTLRRRIQQENTTYKQILERVRQQRATALLQFTQLPILQISLQLGYSQLTSFNAAYKRWTGLTPGAIRSDSKNKAL